ncbi:hypothetical protein GUJ93_ZPchr0005g15588 [Zizania palustris]|uniref:Uncharacterized protein n=1 Tax=Zizania palustris TaxID=103762 RepID=A0A8J5SB99_ZIZPA|nr:hypothetical protein GUJ93_ZPchr0005g15588 [Zizania palustris]
MWVSLNAVLHTSPSPVHACTLASAKNERRQTGPHGQGSCLLVNCSTVSHAIDGNLGRRSYLSISVKDLGRGRNKRWRACRLAGHCPSTELNVWAVPECLTTRHYPNRRALLFPLPRETTSVCRQALWGKKTKQDRLPTGQSAMVGDDTEIGHYRSDESGSQDVEARGERPSCGLQWVSAKDVAMRRDRRGRRGSGREAGRGLSWVGAENNTTARRDRRGRWGQDAAGVAAQGMW